MTCIISWLKKAVTTETMPVQKLYKLKLNLNKLSLVYIIRLRTVACKVVKRNNIDWNIFQRDVGRKQGLQKHIVSIIREAEREKNFENLFVFRYIKRKMYFS